MNKLELLMFDFLKNGKSLEKFAEAQSKSQQEHNFRLQREQRDERITEKYKYLKHLIELGGDLSDEEHKEFKFAKWFVEMKLKHEPSL